MCEQLITLRIDESIDFGYLPKNFELSNNARNQLVNKISQMISKDWLPSEINQVVDSYLKGYNEAKGE